MNSPVQGPAEHRDFWLQRQWLLYFADKCVRECEEEQSSGTAGAHRRDRREHLRERRRGACWSRVRALVRCRRRDGGRGRGRAVERQQQEQESAKREHKRHYDSALLGIRTVVQVGVLSRCT